ncbi:anti-CBASS protein Acb1 family protein [Sphingomonas sp. 1P08PE]|uniref:phage portal protein n=1 Tax=Sphingomonas sp. 1P08PE TaxID=554122 RepID=UPI0039A0D493
MAGSAILDSRGNPMAMLDSVTSAIQSAATVHPFQQQQSAMSHLFAPQLAFAAYLASGLLQKVIEIPASDRVREWRDWQADKDQIEAIEAEERRLGLVAKVKQAETLRGIGGGALILAAPGNPDQPIGDISKGQLQAINVVSRWQLTGENYVTELTDPAYGTPRMWSMANEKATAKIHPSRVICFRGDPLPSGYGVSGDQLFWGQSRLVRVWRDVERSDQAQGWFAALVRKAKLLRIGIPKLTDYTMTDNGQQRLDRRMAAIAMGESVLNATVFDSGDGMTPAETITDYQVQWTGIPAMMDAFDQRVAAVADIPFTRLMGRSPAGMNATGAYDDQNWAKTVSAGQQLETRPCLEQLDRTLIQSAGADPEKVTWKWAPLWAPTEKEDADTFKVLMEAVEKVQGTGAIPDRAFAEGFQNLLEEREYIPGLGAALAKIPEAERFGLAEREPEIDADGNPIDPSSIQTEGGDPASTRRGGGDDGSVAPARRAANDAKPISLYVQRKLLNADELIRWAKAQGFKSTLDASDMHVTVLYSRTPVDPIKMGTTWADNDKGELSIKPGGPRAIERLGESAVVLLFASDDLSWRHRAMVEAGASHDYEEYQPHVTLTYDAGDVYLDAIKPFVGALRFGPELFEPLDLDWKSKVTEADA